MIKDGNERKYLLSRFPEIKKEKFRELELEFLPQYLIYKKSGSRYDCLCTRCRRKFTADDKYIKHKLKGQCPSCGGEVMYLSCGMSRNYIYDMEKFAFVTLSEGNVFIEVFEAVQKFTETGYFNILTSDSNNVMECIWESYHRYCLTPDGAQHWQNCYHWGKSGVDCFWEERKSENEPYIGNCYFSCDQNYYLIGAECLKNSFLKYAVKCYKDLGTGMYKPIKYLCEYANHPHIEYLIKSGFRFIVIEKLRYNRVCGVRINYRSNDVKKILGLNKTEMELLSNTDCHTLSRYKQLKKLSPVTTAENLLKIAKGYMDIEKLESIMQATGLTLKKVMNYKERQLITINNWYDYILQCRNLEYDLHSEAVSKPKDFRVAHAELTALIKIKESEIRAEEFEKNNKKRKKMPFRDDELGLQVILPKNVKEIIYEGAKLSHCVGSYAERHACGELNILFLRKTEALDTPYYTMEVSKKGKIIQCRGYKNNSVSIGGTAKTEDIKIFEKEYQAYLDTLYNRKGI